MALVLAAVLSVYWTNCVCYVTVCQRRWKGQHFCIRNISSKVHFLFWAVKVSLWVRFPYSVGYIISGFPESEIQPPFVSNCQHLQTPLVHMCTTISWIQAPNTHDMTSFHNLIPICPCNDSWVLTMLYLHFPFFNRLVQKPANACQSFVEYIPHWSCMPPPPSYPPHS